MNTMAKHAMGHLHNGISEQRRPQDIKILIFN